MIPEYLKGMNAAEIMAAQRKKFFTECENEYDNMDGIHYDYAKHLETMLLMAVGDALCNCDTQLRVNELVAGISDGPNDRGIVFLNMVLPYENINKEIK
jgi:hypothetical protein